MKINLTSFFLTLLSTVSCANDCLETGCTCTPFGKRVKVKCVDIQQVPCSRIPHNTVQLDLSDNPSVTFIDEDCFRNLTSLVNILLNNDNVKGGFFLPENVQHVEMKQNKLTLDDLKVIVDGKRKLSFLNIEGNPIGPTLTAHTFASLDNMRVLSMSSCNLRHIEDESFMAMRYLESLILDNNLLSTLHPGTFYGLSDTLKNIRLQSNNLSSIADGTFRNFSNLILLWLQNNRLSSVPDLTGILNITDMSLSYNNIKQITWLGKYGIRTVSALYLDGNVIEEIPLEVFQNLSIVYIDLSFNKIQSIADGAFHGCQALTELYLNFNNISHINADTFSGLGKLSTLMIANNNLTAIPNDTFSKTLLNLLFLHNNKIESVEQKAFHRLSSLQSLTLFNNPFRLLPSGIFDELTSETKISITCKNLLELPPGKYTSMIKCAPSASFYLEIYVQFKTNKGLERAGFSCSDCFHGAFGGLGCYNCSLCTTGHYSDRHGSCVSCPAGGFYQDEIGGTDWKLCSVGTYVPKEISPGRKATDCQACPYGTRSNETAGYRACRCLDNFYRLDRFGPCTACPDYGINCENDTGILAPNYFWKWSNKTMEYYMYFVDSIHSFGPEYNKNFSKFQGPLPRPLKCPYPGSCKGGISSACNIGYQGTLCATCSYNHYLRFNSCLQCPRMYVTIISCVLVIVVFVFLFLMVVWGDSTKTENDNTRTVADVIMSCSKIVIGFYQVVAGIFSALVRVQWPVILISMEKYLKFVEGNILQFAPLSCIDHVLRLDPFLQFVLAIVINILIVFLILFYLFLMKRYIMNRMDILPSQKMNKISSLKKSCYRNIFLFLLLSYPMTSQKIIHILPLPGVCEDMCFTKDGSDCISLLKADYSIHCFTARHNVFWHIAAAFALYPVVFPLLLLIPIYKYRESNPDEEEIAFGIRVFFENYKPKYWFWEIVEMYRKLILISVILLVGSESRSQIGFAVIAASASGIAYTIFRPIKSKFEDRLQTFVLWIIFFNVCLGAIYSQPDVSRNPGKNNSIIVNVMFVVLNSAVLILAVGNGLLHLKLAWKIISSCPVRCFRLICRRCLERHRNRNMNNLLLIQPVDEDLDFEDD